jgi:hypothetical protein
MLLRVGRAADARALLERWLADDDVPADAAQYERLVELYAVHTLGALRDGDAARAFLQHHTPIHPELTQARAATARACATGPAGVDDP